MAAKKKQYPKLIEPPWEPTHFTREDLERAVSKVLEEDRLAAEARRLRRLARKKPEP
jgi:UDP:flavonoid glycosyltransferase YjiC (YdhE family)